MNMPKGYQEIEIDHPDFKEDFKTGRIDELCSCGRLKSEHQPTIWHGKAMSEGHGQCAESRCPKFTWVAFVRKVE